MSLFAMEGATTRELLSYRGRLVLHHNRREMEWLFPGQRVVELVGSTPAEVGHRLGRAAMWLRDHPDMAPVRWPLSPKEFL